MQTLTGQLAARPHWSSVTQGTAFVDEKTGDRYYRVGAGWILDLDTAWWRRWCERRLPEIVRGRPRRAASG